MGAQVRWLKFRFASFPYFNSIMSASAPSEADLQAKAGGLKKAETRASAAGVDPAVKALFEKTWDDNGGDKAKICAALGLDAGEWKDGCTKAEFVAKFGN